jgi:3'-5' exoribonuclease
MSEIESPAFTPIRQLNDKESISERPFLVKDKVKGMGKNGKPFLSLLIGDKTGHIDGRVWDRVEELTESFEIGDIIVVKGQVQVYLGRKQIIVHKIEKKDQAQYQKEQFIIEDIKIDVHALYSQLILIVNDIQTPPIKQLLNDCLGDDEIKSLLLKAPAAKSIHHAKRGGLLEHIVSICGLMKMIATHYTHLNEDLLIFGAVFHDIGKVWELDIKNDQIQYSHKGRLLGHMQLACELIDRKSQRILGFPEDLREVLKHIVLSHHGKIEYGSPVRPYIMEAFVVAAIDDLDSKMDTMFGFIRSERETGESWSRYSEHFDRYFYLENLKGKWL